MEQQKNGALRLKQRVVKKYLWNQWTWNSLSSSVHPFCPLEISLKFISSRQSPVFNLEFLTYYPISPITMENWYNRPIVNYLFLCLNNIPGAVRKTN